MRFAPLKIARISKDKKSLERTSNLTESGKELRSVFDSDEQFLFYVSGCVNSGLVQKGFASRAKVSTSPIPLIAPTDENLASKARSVAETTKDLASLEEFADEWRIGGKKGSSDPIKFSRIINDLCEKHDIEKQTISQVTAHLIWKTLIEKNETEVAYLYGVEIPTDLRSKKGITQESAERLEDTTKELGSSSQK
jgi:hypothetical protein